MSRTTITYSWRLREIMAARGLNNISDLIPLLTERGGQHRFQDGPLGVGGVAAVAAGPVMQPHAQVLAVVAVVTAAVFNDMTGSW